MHKPRLLLLAASSPKTGVRADLEHEHEHAVDVDVMMSRSDVKPLLLPGQLAHGQGRLKH